jgi:hypothetical protein
VAVQWNVGLMHARAGRLQLMRKSLGRARVPGKIDPIEV